MNPSVDTKGENDLTHMQNAAGAHVAKGVDLKGLLYLPVSQAGKDYRLNECT